MKVEQINIFSTKRLQMDESIQLTIQSLLAYTGRYEHWAMAWSGGKDSTTLLTLVIYLIESKQIPAPKTLTIFYADTRLELTPLNIAALNIIDQLKERGYNVKVVMAEMDKRFMVYMLGRGVPPPNNQTLRWCTQQIKIKPMEIALAKLSEEHGKVLMLTGVRQGESAIRDGRIAMSCGKDLIIEKGGLLSFIRHFEKSMMTEESIWLQKCKNRPTQDILYVYIIVCNQVRYRCFYAGHATGPTEIWNGDGFSWSSRSIITWPRILLAGPFVKAPNKIIRPGFQGFRYTTKLF